MCVIIAGSLEWSALSSEGFCLLVFAELLVSIPEISVLVSRKHIGLRNLTVKTMTHSNLYLSFS